MYCITTIVSRLNIGERLFLPDLASEFGVSLRTIQKDFSTRQHDPRQWSPPRSYSSKLKALKFY